MGDIFLDVSFQEVALAVKDESYLTQEVVMKMGCFERFVRWLFSWIPLVDSVTVTCAKRSLAFIKETFAEKFAASKKKTTLFDRCRLLRSLYEEDLQGTCAELLKLSECVHDLFVSFLSVDLFFSGLDPRALRAPMDGQCMLARLYINGGEHTSKNPVRGKELLELLAKNNHPRACYDLAVLYHAGADGVPRDHRKALDLLRKSVDLKYVYAQYQLGHLHRHGNGVSKDVDEARRLFRLAVAQGHAGARVALEEMKPTGIQRARDYLRSFFGASGSSGDGELSALQGRSLGGEAAAQVILGQRYVKGDGVEVDYDRARHLFATAAAVFDAEVSNAAVDALIRSTQQGAAAGAVHEQRTSLVPFEYGGGDITKDMRARCLCAIGEYFLETEHYDPERAVNCLRLAKRKGSLEARLLCARCYERGEGVARNPREARRQVEKAVERRYPPALCKHARYLFTGYGGRRDPQQAIKELRISADRGHAPAKAFLAECAFEGKGMRKNPRRGIRLLQELVHDHGNETPTHALILLAEQLETGGAFVAQDVDEARRLYQLAADRGSVVARLHLAKMVEEGDGVDVMANPFDAFDLYQEAYGQEQGARSFGGVFEEARPATLQLARCNEEGIGCGVNPRRALKLYHEAARYGSRPAAETLLEIYQGGSRLDVSRHVANSEAMAKKIQSFLRNDRSSRSYQRVATDLFRDPFPAGI